MDGTIASTPSSDSGAGAERSTGRLTGWSEWFWYVAAAVGYINLGIWNKWLLNWVMGPVWLVVTVCVGPAVVEFIRGLASRFSSRAADR